jgi:glycosyltransferase involved in cell wall biosynthesis
MSHGNLGGTLVRAAAPRTVPLIWSIHQTLGDYHTLPFNTRFAIRATAYLSGRADVIIFVAKSSMEEHRAIGFRSDRAMFVPNGVDTDLFRGGRERRAEARTLLGIAAHVPVIGHVARYHPSKDQATLLAALKIVFSGGRQGCVILIGRDLTVANRELAVWLNDRQLGPHLKLLGPRSDVARLLPAFDLFCLSSAYNEACPVAVLEAMSCGVPCVVTDIADSAWIVGDTGGVAPARDAMALAAQITRVLDAPRDATESASRRARERILERFSLDQMIESYCGIYIAAMERRHISPRATS